MHNLLVPVPAETHAKLKRLTQQSGRATALLLEEEMELYRRRNFDDDAKLTQRHKSPAAAQASGHESVATIADGSRNQTS